MTTTLELLQAGGVFLLGLLARAGLVLAVIALLSLPLMAVALLLRAAASLRRRRSGLGEVSGLLLHPGLHYAPSHAWLAPRRSGLVAVGLDDLALRLLPSVTGLEAGPPGRSVRRGEPLLKLLAGGRTLVVPAPLAGTVVAINPAVRRDPGLAKREGYGRGWLVAVRPADQAWRGLPTGAGAEQFLRGEAARWNRFVEGELGFAAADGGRLVAPAPQLLDEAAWHRLVSAFVGGA
jgi:glycine cleavage system H lipoate-binding protein